MFDLSTSALTVYNYRVFSQLFAEYNLLSRLELEERV